MNDFTFTKEAFEDYLYWQIQDKKTMKRINSLLKDIRANGAMKGTGKPEKLKYRPGYSRRIAGFYCTTDSCFLKCDHY